MQPNQEWIQLRGVRVHNLKNVDVDLPRGQLIAVCGVSGSGKTSLAIDTLYAEGQRRYIESFSAYTRQFLQRLDKPACDRIDGLTPALAVTRGTAQRSNRSTVGTASESADYLRLLFAKVSSLHCYRCGRRIEPATVESTSQWIQRLPPNCRLMIGFAIHWEDVAQRAAVLAELQQAGLVRLVSKGKMLQLSEARDQLVKSLPRRGSVLMIVDRLRGGEKLSRSGESLETAFFRGLGQATILVEAGQAAVDSALADQFGLNRLSTKSVDEASWYQLQFTQQLACPDCQIDYPTPETQLFSFNSPLGACPKCEGFGDTTDWDMSLIVPDRRKTIAQGAIAPWNSPSYRECLNQLLEQSEQLRIPTDVPFSKLSTRQVDLLRRGDSTLGFGGLDGFFQYLERKKYKMHVRVFLSRWRSYSRCDGCQGQRLNPKTLAYRVAGRNIAELCAMSVVELKELIQNDLHLDDRQQQIASLPLQQLLSRLNFLQSVGLGYLTLDRTLRTLSGGEAQRTALTAVLGSSLVNMLYVLDEPSVGLHPHDVQHLALAIDTLRGRGNTVVMIEHEEDLLRRAEWVVEVGPEAGSHGGQIVFSGTQDQLTQTRTLTSDYLTGTRIVPAAQQPRQPTGWLKLTGCRGNNLQGINVEFPLGVLCLVTGISGSGKSSLVQDTLYGAIINRIGDTPQAVLPHDGLTGISPIHQCMLIDQSPVSRSPRSNPVTYVKAFDEIRNLFAACGDAKIRGLSPAHFSFNSELGRCVKCEGDGILQVDMHFLADIQMVCPDCQGSRYKSDILQVRYRDTNIAELLKLTVRDAYNFFRGQQKIQTRLEVLMRVGLDYLTLGQSATTLSAGEAQRLKLAGFLASASQKRTLFILDEPTTGLHTHDVVQLLDCFDALLQAGNSLILVEHNLHLINAADYLIDLGPGAATMGGRIVAAGTPDQLIASPDSVTGQYLKAFRARRDQLGASQRSE